MCHYFVLSIDILLDHDKLNRRHVVDMIHKGLNRYVIEDVRFKGFHLTLTLTSDSNLRMTTVKKDIEQIFTCKEEWLDMHTDLRLKSIRCISEK